MKKNSDYLKSPDLFPITHSERKVSTFGFSVLWVGMAVVLAAFALGGDGVQSLPLVWVLVASVIGCMLIGFFITVTADVGVEHGLSFPVYMRAPFGTIGTHIPSIVRGITASIWFGINTYFGAAAINGILNVMTGFDNWFICFLLFAAVQLINVALGIKAVEKFANLAAPTIILIAIWMYFTLAEQASAIDRNVWTWIENPVSGTMFFTAFMTIIVGGMGYWATLAADSSSLSRFVKAPKFERNWAKRNKGVLVGSVVALPLTQTLVVAIGGVAYIAVGNYDPIVALQETSSGFILSVLLLMIVLAQWSTNTSANVIPAATIFSNAGGPKVPFYGGVILAGVIGAVTQPWNLFNVLIPFLLVVAGILSAIVGVIFADYYLLRKRRLNVHDLYEKDGQYRYLHGINWAGIIAWVIGGAVAIMFPTYSFFVGFMIGAGAYYVLAKYWWFQKYKQAEVEDPDDEKYLGITVGRDWIIDSDEDAYQKLEKTAN